MGGEMGGGEKEEGGRDKRREGRAGADKLQA